jgi:tyrosyl-tRNA synthetase
MADNLIEIFKERGFIEKTTHEGELAEYLEGGDITCYIGFDPTASSLHVGHLVPIMSLVHAQRRGGRPIALIGGGTGMVGDPSGKTEMRRMLTREVVDENAACLKKQLSAFIDFEDARALLLNNDEWLARLEYIPFLRDVGRHFSVNRMIKAESYKSRIESETGLSFIEFNYMVLQAFDFLMLYDLHGCRLQMGGSDQWGNIVAGIELIRKMRQETTFGITFPLIMTSQGEKMGKTAKGAVWLDPEKTSPYEYFQFWVNTDDRDVERFLALFTLLPMEEIREVRRLTGVDMNAAKAVLAFEATRFAHGEVKAVNAYRSAASLFGAREISGELLPGSSIPRAGGASVHQSVPTSFMKRSGMEGGIPAFKLFHQVGLANSGAASRRLIEQGGAYANSRRIESIDDLITTEDIRGNEILLRAGKKRYHKVKFED